MFTLDDRLNGSDVSLYEIRDFSQLDRALGNATVNPSFSYHYPLLLVKRQPAFSGGRPVRFFNYLVEHASFQSVVASHWTEHVTGNPMFSVWTKWKTLKGKLKQLNSTEFAGVQTRIQEARAEQDSNTQLPKGNVAAANKN